MSDFIKLITLFFIVFAFAAAIIMLIAIVSGIRNVLTKCSHGLRFGWKDKRDHKFNSKCILCYQEKEARDKQNKLEREQREVERVRKSEILRIEEETRSSEIKRLHSWIYTSSVFSSEISPRDFEFAIAAIFETKGYSCTVTKASSDGGKDIIARKNGRTYLIECKKYGVSKKIGRPDIQKLHSAVISFGAQGGIFVTTSFFSNEAIIYASQSKPPIEVIDKEKLASMIPQQGNLFSMTYQSICRSCGHNNSLAYSDSSTPQVCGKCKSDDLRPIRRQDIDSLNDRHKPRITPPRRYRRY